ncbi:MAG TPA: hypothetical protein VL284_08590 [Thermoanaerobaculia bacterium]|nr:hypothetical protein [Thermoanaerobaculia bacterium]
MTLTVVTVVGLVVLAILVWLYVRVRSKDILEEIIARRRATSRLANRAVFVEGLEEFPVVLSLTSDTISYENPDLEAKLDLAHIDEVEYDDETATGRAVHGKALRLRSHGHTFEFVVDPATAQQWHSALPPRRLDQGTAQAV